MADLNVQLILRLVDRATAPARSAVRALERLGGEGFMRNAQRVNRGAVMMASGLGSVTGASIKGGLVLAGYAGTMAALSGTFLGPAAEMERFKVQLVNLEGSAEGADRAMRWIMDFATRTPLELNQTVEAYAKLRAFGLDPTNGSLQALVDTMAASGRGAEQLDGLVLALGQAWTKGKLQGEEALQMLERGVPVWDLLGKKMGKNAAQLQEMASKGKLGRKEITLLIEALAERNKGASDNMAKTWDGILSKMSDFWYQFRVMVMSSGVFDYLKERLNEIFGYLDAMAADGRLQKLADQVAGQMLAALKGIWAFALSVRDAWQRLYPVLEQVAEALGGWDRLAWLAVALVMGKTVWGLISGFVMLAQGIMVVSTGLIGMASYASGLVAVLSLVARILRSTLVMGLRGLALGASAARTAILWLGRALMLALRAAGINPIVAVIAAIATAAYLIYRNWDKVGPWFARLWASIKAIFQGFYEFVAGIFTGDMGRAVSGLQQIWDGIIGYYRTIWNGIVGLFHWAWDNGIAPVLDKLGLLDPIIAAWQAFKEAIGSVLDWIGAKFEAGMEKIRPVIDALRWVHDKGTAAVAAVFGSEGEGAARGASGSWGPPASVPGRALGGPVRAGQIYRWQEEGQEFFVPRSDGEVISNRQLRLIQSMADAPSAIRIAPAAPRPAGGAAPARSLRLDIGGITISAAAGMDPAAIARAVRRELENLTRERGFALHDGGEYACPRSPAAFRSTTR